mmetsp:Transcript_72877/g.126520  ORF Transcript_72877/g.126520 Transcript_72877/m.126520 type:complete len:731 (-) Transcript_72877:75-2267(-)
MSQQPPATNGKARSSRSNSLARLLVAALISSCGPQGANAQVACEDIQASSGIFPRWPVQNPGLVANVALQWDYPTYENPLALRFTGKSLAIELPTSYMGGFKLTDPAKPTAPAEQYRLTQVELRRPAAIPEGSGQVLSHQWEAVLIHQETSSSYWANVVVPFTVTTSGAVADIVQPMIEGVKLPSTLGAVVPVMASATSRMKLDAVFLSDEFANTTFHHFWGTADVDGCTTKNVNVRYLLRSSTLGVGQDTASALTNTLKDVPAQGPTETTSLPVFLVEPCKNGTTCVIPPAADLKTMLTSATTVQSGAVDEQRERKANLDQLLPKLGNHTGPATKESIALFEEAVAADTALKAAVAELNSAQATFEQVTLWSTQADSTKWDADKPPETNTTAAAGKNKTSFLMQDTLLEPVPEEPAQEAAPQEVASQEQPMAMGGALGDGSLAPAEQGRDCSALGRSPIDINLAQVVDPTAVSLKLHEPLAFHHMLLQVDAQPPSLQIDNLGRFIRVSSAPGELGWPFGAVLLDGHDRDISYVDVHVPGQHTVNGRAPAAELQLVHQSANGRAIAVAVPLDVKATDDSLDDDVNDWIRPLLKTKLPSPFRQKEAYGRPLGELHSALGAGATGNYFRYDGTLTASPCLPAEWYVLQDAGTISHSQLAALRSSMLGGAVATKQQRFPASLVMQGTHSLITEVGSLGQRTYKGNGGLRVHRDGGLAQTSGTVRFRGRRRLQV